MKIASDFKASDFEVRKRLLEGKHGNYKIDSLKNQKSLIIGLKEGSGKSYEHWENVGMIIRKPGSKYRSKNANDYILNPHSRVPTIEEIGARNVAITGAKKPSKDPRVIGRVAGRTYNKTHKAKKSTVLKTGEKVFTLKSEDEKIYSTAAERAKKRNDSEYWVNDMLSRIEKAEASGIVFDKQTSEAIEKFRSKEMSLEKFEEYLRDNEYAIYELLEGSPKAKTKRIEDQFRNPGGFGI